MTSYQKYPDGFPKNPLEAIDFCYFLSDAEKQEWKDWLKSSNSDQQTELVDILHSMWLDNQKNAVPESFANNVVGAQGLSQSQRQEQSPINSPFARQDNANPFASAPAPTAPAFGSNQFAKPANSDDPNQNSRQNNRNPQTDQNRTSGQNNQFQNQDLQANQAASRQPNFTQNNQAPQPSLQPNPQLPPVSATPPNFGSNPDQAPYPFAPARNNIPNPGLQPNPSVPPVAQFPAQNVPQPSFSRQDERQNNFGQDFDQFNAPARPAANQGPQNSVSPFSNSNNLAGPNAFGQENDRTARSDASNSYAANFSNQTNNQPSNQFTPNFEEKPFAEPEAQSPRPAQNQTHQRPATSSQPAFEPSEKPFSQPFSNFEENKAPDPFGGRPNPIGNQNMSQTTSPVASPKPQTASGNNQNQIPSSPAPSQTPAFTSLATPVPDFAKPATGQPVRTEADKPEENPFASSKPTSPFSGSADINNEKEQIKVNEFGKQEDSKPFYSQPQRNQSTQTVPTPEAEAPKTERPKQVKEKVSIESLVKGNKYEPNPILDDASMASTEFNFGREEPKKEEVREDKAQEKQPERKPEPQNRPEKKEKKAESTEINGFVFNEDENNIDGSKDEIKPSTEIKEEALPTPVNPDADIEAAKDAKEKETKNTNFESKNDRNEKRGKNNNANNNQNNQSQNNQSQQNPQSSKFNSGGMNTNTNSKPSKANFQSKPNQNPQEDDRNVSKSTNREVTEFFNFSKIKQASSKKVLEETYQEYVQILGSSQEKYNEFLQKITDILLNFGQMSNYFESVMGKVLEMNDKLVKQAGQIQNVQNTSQSATSSLQYQVDSLRYDVEKLSRELTTTRVEIGRRVDNAEAQLATVGADAYQGQGTDHKLELIRSDLVEMQNRLQEMSGGYYQSSNNADSQNYNDLPGENNFDENNSEQSFDRNDLQNLQNRKNFKPGKNNNNNNQQPPKQGTRRSNIDLRGVL